MFDLTGKTVLITGGAGYLGSEVCRGVVSCGARVVLADINEKAMKAVYTELLAAEPEAAVRYYLADCTDTDQLEPLLEKVLEEFGSLDILIHTVYFRTNKTFDQLREDEFSHSNEINITTAFALIKRAVPMMPDGSSILLFSSMYGLISPNPADYPEGIVPNPVEYGVGKAAVNQLIRYAAGWCGKRQIRVNAVAPGAFPWNVTSEEFLRRLSRKSMLGRVGKQNEIAGIAVFLASDEASFITGQVISVDGGITVW